MNKTDSNGLKQGEWEYYRPDGTLRMKCNYKNDKLIGKVEIYDGDKVIYNGYYFNDKKINKLIYKILQLFTNN